MAIEEDPHPEPLPYATPARPARPATRPGAGLEAFLGFLAYFALLATLAGAWAEGVRQSFGMVALTGLVALMGLAIYLHLARGWRGFGAGLAIGVGLSCLVLGAGVGYVIYTCKGI